MTTLCSRCDWQGQHLRDLLEHNMDAHGRVPGVEYEDFPWTRVVPPSTACWCRDIQRERGPRTIVLTGE